MSEKRTRWVPTGVEVLDDLFGGFPRKAISLFWGSTGVLKTTVACYVPIIQTFDEKIEEQVFVVMDNEGGFDWDRLFDMAKHNGIDLDLLEERVKVFDISSFDEQKSFICKKLFGGRQKVFNQECDVKDCQRAGQGSEESYHYHMFNSIFDEGEELAGKIPSLIAIDSISWLAKTEVMTVPMRFRMGKMGEYTNEMGIQLALIRRVAIKYDCVATVTTWDGSKMGEALGGGGEFPFLGGRSVAFIPKLNIFLSDPVISEEDKQIEGWANLRQATVWKHRCMERFKTTFFVVDETGVRDPTEWIARMSGQQTQAEQPATEGEA